MIETITTPLRFVENSALALIDADVANLYAALRWALSADPAIAMRLAARLCDYWMSRNDPVGLEWFEAALAVATPAVADIDRARVLRGLAGQFQTRQRYDDARAACEQGLTLYRQVGDQPEVVDAYVRLAMISWSLDGRGR